MKEKTVKKIIIIGAIMMYCGSLLSQSSLPPNTGGVSINLNNAPPHESAILDVTSQEKGVLIPRITMTEMGAISAPAEGLTVFITSSGFEGFWYFVNGNWEHLQPASAFNDFGKTPIGGIILWSGSGISSSSFDSNGNGIVGTDTEGWSLCLGSINSTPDLKGKFVVGYDPAITEYSITSTGGLAHQTLIEDNLPAHKHDINDADIQNSLSVTVNPHTHTISDPGHRHSYITDNGTAGGYADKGGAQNNGNYWTNSSYTGISINQCTSLTANINWNGALMTEDVGNGQSFDNRPPYYVIAYIIRKF